MIVAEAESRGIPLDQLRGTVQNYVLPGGEGPGLRGNGAVDLIEFCARHLPHWNHTSISIRNLRDTGLSAVQELAFGLYQGIFTIETALARSMEIDQFASRISYFLSAENELLEEMAKFRAYRRMWARLLREEYGAQREESWALRFHVQTSALSLTAQQPLNNIVRATIHALAAVLGGAQSMSVNSYDEALGLPAASAAVLSLRTQQIILHESGVDDVIDPMGGSYCIEALTDELEKAALPLIRSLREMGGEQAFRYISEQTKEQAYRRQRATDAGERVVVGVNKFTMKEEEELPLHPREVFETDPRWREKQMERLDRVKRDRDEAGAQAALRRLVDAYTARDNIVPPTVEAVKAYLSIGEIIKALAAAEGWEALRKRRGFILGLYG
jgi:methylmalonyl-CoA mutase N-terminal domain/subunit